MERLTTPSPPVGEPHPEETIEALELRSLEAAAKQDELLPQREVLEREVSAGSERRTKRAQQNEYQGHCLPGSHAAGPSSRLYDRILANDNTPVRASKAEKGARCVTGLLGPYNGRVIAMSLESLVGFGLNH